MPDLRPLRGIRYSPRAGNLVDLVAPPYDVIGPEEHAKLCLRSTYNIVRLILGERPSPQIGPPPDWYGQAARLLAAWQREGILVQDAELAFYLYSQAFDHEGRRLRRKLLLSALRLEAYGSGSVFPHENTHAGPKADRLRLMTACRANLSPILAFFPDHGAAVNGILEGLIADEPAAAFTDDVGIQHELRCILNAEAQEALRLALAPLPLYIADGHHRYETALAYRHAERRRLADPVGDLACDFILAASMSGADPGLVIRPTHRVVSWDGDQASEAVLARAERWFSVQRLPGVGVSDALRALAPPGRSVSFILYGGRSAGYALLELRDQEVMDDSPYPRNSPLRGLPAAVFAHTFLTKLLGPLGARVCYTPDAAEAVQQANAGSRMLACLLPCVRPSELMAVVDAGERMPPKSTYFWPKPMTGMVLRSLERF